MSGDRKRSQQIPTFKRATSGLSLLIGELEAAVEDADVRSSEPSPTMERVGSLIEEVEEEFGVTTGHTEDPPVGRDHPLMSSWQLKPKAVLVREDLAASSARSEPVNLMNSWQKKPKALIFREDEPKLSRDSEAEVPEEILIHPPDENFPSGLVDPYPNFDPSCSLKSVASSISEMSTYGEVYTVGAVVFGSGHATVDDLLERHG